MTKGFRGRLAGGTRLQTAVIVVTALSTFLACGGKKEQSQKAHKDAGVQAAPTVAPIATPTVGVETIKRMAFYWSSDGSDYLKKAVPALASKTRDWAAIRAGSEATLAKDPHHYDAHRSLASALVQSQEYAAAVNHLVTALAADYVKYGPNLESDPDLEPLWKTPHGTAVKEVAAKIREELQRRAASGLWLVGRRNGFSWPKNPGVQPSSTRGELYAFDRETKRYLRLTHTNDQVAGFVRSPSGNEVAVLGFDKIDRPKADDPIPLVARAWVQVIDTTTWKQLAKATITTPARELALGYGAGDQLLVSVAAADGRWGTAAPTTSSIDRSTGKLQKVTSAPPLPRIAFMLEEGRALHAPPEAVKATWSGDPPTAPTLQIGATTIQVPESGIAQQASLAVSPSAARVAFVTAVDPCAKDAAPSLYVADAKSGALKHLLTAKSKFATRWIDDTLLAYEDGDGAIRLWDATSGREAMKLDNRAGIALAVLSLQPAPLCKQAPPTADTGSGAGDELPPEEAAGSGSGAAGPITKPE